MAKIDSFNFGFIVIDGKQYVKDVVILPDGSVKERDPGKSSRLGSHGIRGDEIRELHKSGADVMVVGTGVNGVARLTGDAETYQTNARLNLIILPSSLAVSKFNQLVAEGKRVAALFHITC